MPTRRASSVTLIPSGGIADSTRTWDIRRSPRVPSESSARIRPNRPAISSGSTSSRCSHKPTLLSRARRLGSIPCPLTSPPSTSGPGSPTRPRPSGSRASASARSTSPRCARPARSAAGWAAVWSTTSSATSETTAATARRCTRSPARSWTTGRADSAWSSPTARSARTSPPLGLDVDASLIGDRWAVGDEVVLEVTGPRIPCATFAARMGIRGWLKTFARSRPQRRLPRRRARAARCGPATRSGWSRAPRTTSTCRRRSGRSWATSTPPSTCWPSAACPSTSWPASATMVERRRAERRLTRSGRYTVAVVKSLSHRRSRGASMHDRSALGPADVDDATLTSMVAALLGRRSRRASTVARLARSRSSPTTSPRSPRPVATSSSGDGTRRRRAGGVRAVREGRAVVGTLADLRHTSRTR